jgi:hypothetical protein
VEVEVVSVTADAGSDVSIELGEQVDLVATGGESYQWSTGATTQSITVSPDQTTVYTVQVFKGTCLDKDQVKVWVKDNLSNENDNVTDSGETDETELESVIYAGEDVSICAGEKVTLSVKSDKNIKWSTGDTSSSIEVRPLRTTSYTVRSNNGGVEEIDEVIVYVDNCTFQDENQKRNNVKISASPNPTRGNVNISIRGVSDKLTMAVYDWQGRLLRMEELDPLKDSLERPMDFSRFPKGIYVIKVFNNHFNSTTKILLN